MRTLSWLKNQPEIPWLIVFGLLRVPVHLFHLGNFDEEQAVLGNLGAALVNGLVLPLPQYQYLHYTHREFLMGALHAPFYAVFGAHYWVNALVGWLVTLPLFFVWLRLVRRTFDVAAMHAFAILFVVCPPFFLDIGTRSWGNHYESLLPAGLVFLFLLRACARPGRRRDALFVGLAGGLGSFVSYQVFGPFALGFALLIAFSPAGKRIGAGLAAALGFFAGFSPSIAISHALGGGYDFFLSGDMANRRLDAVAGKGRVFLTEYLPVLPKFEHGWLNVAYLAVAAACGAALAVVLARRTRKYEGKADGETAARLAILLYPPMWCALYLVSNFSILDDTAHELRYAIVLFPFFFAWIAASDRAFGRAARWSLVALIAAATLADGGYATLIGRGAASVTQGGAVYRFREYKGTSDEIFFYLQFPRYIDSLRPCDPDALKRDSLAKLPREYAAIGDEMLGRCVAGSVPCWGEIPDGAAGDACDFNRVTVGCAMKVSQAEFEQPEPRWKRLVPPDEVRADVDPGYWIGVGRGFVRALGVSGERDAAKADAFDVLQGLLEPWERRAVLTGSAWQCARFPFPRCGSAIVDPPIESERLLDFTRGRARGVAQTLVLRNHFIRDQDASRYLHPGPDSRIEQDTAGAFFDEAACLGSRVDETDDPRWHKVSPAVSK